MNQPVEDWSSVIDERLLTELVWTHVGALRALLLRHTTRRDVDVAFSRAIAGWNVLRMTAYRPMPIESRILGHEPARQLNLGQCSFLVEQAMRSLIVMLDAWKKPLEVEREVEQHLSQERTGWLPLKEALIEQLARTADKDGVSVSHVIERGLDAYIARRLEEEEGKEAGNDSVRGDAG